MTAPRVPQKSLRDAALNANLAFLLVVRLNVDRSFRRWPLRLHILAKRLEKFTAMPEVYRYCCNKSLCDIGVIHAECNELEAKVHTA
jgi:hypothetical protein